MGKAGKSKDLLGKQSKKSSKHKASVPVTSDDFQQAADLEEETGGKWRAGDQAKSCRAFTRAIQIYNDGLQKYPKDFDLAYNKARLEFDLSQQPALATKLPMSLLELLQQALQSHRYALRLNEENVDILFNTGQVLIAIAEHVTESSEVPSSVDVVALLREALELLSACYSRQEMLREEQRMQFTDDSDKGGVPLDSASDPSPASAPNAHDDDSTTERSATIQSPITPADLIDTALTSLSALTLLVTLSEPTAIPTLAQMAHSLTDIQLARLTAELSPEERASSTPDIALARAELIAALAASDLKTGATSFPDALERLHAAFAPLDLTSPSASAGGAICTYADALVELVTTAQIFSSSSSAAEEAKEAKPNPAQTYWPPLTLAQALYARALHLSVTGDDPEMQARKPAIYESRGDVEVLRFGLAVGVGVGVGVGAGGGDDASALSASVRASAPTLVKNAQTYYRGAGSLFRGAGEVGEAGRVEVRGLVAGVLEGRYVLGRVAESVVAEVKRRGEVAVGVVRDMEREGLLPVGWDEGLGA